MEQDSGFSLLFFFFFFFFFLGGGGLFSPFLIQDCIAD